MTSITSEEKLRKLLRSNPDKGFEAIFRAYYEEVFRTIVRMIGQAEKAEDISQDLFADLWNKRHHLVISGSIGAYLRRAARNRTLNYLRDHKILIDGADPSETLRVLRSDRQADSHHLYKELSEYISVTIDQMPPRCRLIFVLSRYESLTYAQIAEEMNISIKTVENQISKALRLLREAISDYNRDDY